jgi:parallel beta-helix repeat protein
MAQKVLASLTALLLLLLAILQFAGFSSANFFPDPGPDLPRVFIRSDGSVEPASAPIERAGDLYRLTGDIEFFTVEIQCDNVVLDGSGYAIKGNASRFKGYDDGNNGVVMEGRRNVNITRLTLEQGDTGVRLSNSANINIVNNKFFNALNRGVTAQDSTHILIEANEFADIQSDYPAVDCNGSANIIRNNIFTGCMRGIELEGSSNMVSDNQIEAVLPVALDKANLNTITKNNITGPAPSTVMPDRNYTGNEGIALFHECSNNILSKNRITGFVNGAFRIVFDGSNNTLYGNYLANNEFAIALQEQATKNLFYGNTFVADSCRILMTNAGDNFWDNGTLGNYWGNYNGSDNNADGVGDTPYTINAYRWDNSIGGLASYAGGQDNHPLMAPYNTEDDAALAASPQTLPYLALIAAALTIACTVSAVLFIYRRNHKSKTAI